MKRVFVTIFLIQVLVNLVGALGPELSFDALWYHLPIARLIAERGWWGVIPGGLLYYSGMPRLMEFVNAGLLFVGGEVLVKPLSWFFGILSTLVIYKISRRYWSERASWGAVIVWYGSLVVGWQSIVVYVDLVRTFFVLLAVWYMLEYLEREKKRACFWSALFIGMAYCVKMISVVDGVALGVVAGIFAAAAKGVSKGIKVFGRYMLTLLMFGFFWGGLNVIQGFHFLYPILGDYGLISEHINWSAETVLGPLVVFLDPKYRVGPVVALLVFLSMKYVKRERLRKAALVTVFLFVAWYLTPRTGYGRFFLHTLALLGILGVGVIDKGKGYRRNLGLGLVVTAGIFGIVYRGLANAKFVPYLLGRETREEFLVDHLDFQNGDWYDVGGRVSGVVQEERYAVYGVHNTYYLPGNWDHESFSSEDYCYRYVLVQGGGSGEIVVGMDVIDENPVTRSTLYRNSACD